MSMLIAAFMFIVLLAVSTAHFLWSIGRTWPIRSEKLLAQTVVGFEGIERMPPRLASFAVAVATLAAGIMALALADHDSGGLPLSLLGLPLAAVFLARGVIGYTAWWAHKTPEPNFRLNDTRVYSPLCLFLGLGFVALVILRLL
ncbi:DUF3995 domain-containing protein [Devosia oryziradicis]|uniref:DUF3995 domain-containing protein n=1 Tax=Devosia oryziradicis TaxID=2801335 RepID=A0ABX7C6J1_9HYPH|nr:DUF3995 domain-containing protein [Devosia oryziradicis]QQR37586.1 DUF3995 domain-containing protein [Devosia oryziradicis]